MKLIIGWLSLMVISPLLYLFWWKKKWRLILGIVILVILIIAFFLPGEIIFSYIKRELEKIEELKNKENWLDINQIIRGKPWQKLEEDLKVTLQQEVTPQNQVKLNLEKEILELREKGKKFQQEIKQTEEKKIIAEAQKKLTKNNYLLNKKEWEWIVKWSGKKPLPTLLFCGEEFNDQLIKKRKINNYYYQLVQDREDGSNVIDFDKHGTQDAKFLQKKILEIYNQSQNYLDAEYFFPWKKINIFLFKNIDKITNSNLEQEFLTILDPNKNTDLGKYQKELLGEKLESTIDLSKFLLIVTTSKSNPKLANKLRSKTKHVEPFLDKYFWIIVVGSLGIEILIFVILIKKINKKET